MRVWLPEIVRGTSQQSSGKFDIDWHRRRRRRKRRRRWRRRGAQPSHQTQEAKTASTNFSIYSVPRIYLAFKVL